MFHVKSALLIKTANADKKCVATFWPVVDLTGRDGQTGPRSKGELVIVSIHTAGNSPTQSWHCETQ